MGLPRPRYIYILNGVPVQDGAHDGCCADLGVAYDDIDPGVAYYDIEDTWAPAGKRVLALRVRLEAARRIVMALNAVE